MKKNLLIVSTFLLALAYGCKKSEEITVKKQMKVEKKDAVKYSGDFVRPYYDLTCEIVKTTPGFFPTQAARAYGYISIALYEATVQGISSNLSLQGQINGLAKGMLPKPEHNLEYNWALAANASIADIMRKMFEINISQENLTLIDQLESDNKSALSAYVNTDVIIRSEVFGKAIANAVYEYSKSDGGHHSYLDPFQLPYTVPTGEDKWVPTGPVHTPVSPKWGENRPFLTENVTQTMPPPPYLFSSQPGSALYKEAFDVYTQVKNNTPEHIAIAKFWADDPKGTCTPAGHTFKILSFLLEENNASLAKTATSYAKMGIAENDAFIACWKCKFKDNLLRPVTYIQRYIDPAFTTVIGTPPFPSYISGHSTEIAAASKIFCREFTNGDSKYKIVDRSQVSYGLEIRTWNSFNEMADECANSRFYAGIHYQQDNKYGLLQGKKVGEFVNENIKWPKGI